MLEHHWSRVESLLIRPFILSLIFEMCIFLLISLLIFAGSSLLIGPLYIGQSRLLP
jgi:hypothetical protein